MKKISLTSFLLLLTYSVPSFSWNALTHNFDIKCEQFENLLNCDYRTLKNISISSISASSNNIDLTIENTQSFLDSGEQTAILFLIDTSDPGRKNVVEKNKKQLKEFFSNLKANEKAGIASFDKSLNILSPIGSSTSSLNEALNKLKATGLTTELYRNLLQAMEHLDTTVAKRKLLVLLSDGQAEDKAYFHSDVIKMARSSGIVINSIGFPRSVTLSVSLQVIRRLSEETGGSYIESDMSYDLPINETKLFFNSIDTGGHFSVSLDALSQSAEIINTVTVAFNTEKGNKLVRIPVAIKNQKKIVEAPVQITPEVIPQKTESISETKEINNVPIQIITKQAPQQPVNLWLWYGLPAAFIIIIIFMLIILYLLWRKPIQKSSSPTTEYRPYAYLISNDKNKTRYPITRTICRVGRSKDNEICLDDTSVSRRHAEIHRTNEGKFEIIDTNSTNGIYINNEKIGKAELNEEDLLEIGDFFMNFTLHAADYAFEEQTEMQNTRMPSIS